MDIFKVTASFGLVVVLSGCATTSFAPPVVDLTRIATVTTAPVGKPGATTRQIRPCENQISYDGGKIGDNVQGARALINNFLYIYRCRAHGAANGRQSFEVPALLIAGGAATAAAFGASSGVAIAGGAAGAALGAGKSYYAPAQKAEIYDHALDALLCIKTEAVNVAAFDLQAQAEHANEAAKDAIGESGKGAEGSADQGPVVTASEQYFDMVSAALFSVERVLASRLSATGKFDTAGLVAELEALQKKVEAAEAAKNAQTGKGTETAAGEKPKGEAPLVAESVAHPDQRVVDEMISTYSSELSLKLSALASAPPAAKAAKAADVKLTANKNSAYVQLDLLIIQPKLQKCVVRAKL